MKKCKDLVKENFNERIKDIKTLFYAENNETEELGHLYKYGLCIDRVEAGTFKDQQAPYKRYQLSWGGPADEFRLYDNGKVEYWYLDWYDGAKIDVEGTDAEIVKNIIQNAL